MQLIPNYSFSPDNEPVGSVLHYLEHDLPGYQFEAEIDMPFILELLADFPEIDILEELKNFRWYHDTAPLLRNQRPARFYPALDRPYGCAFSLSPLSVIT